MRTRNDYKHNSKHFGDVIFEDVKEQTRGASSSVGTVGANTRSMSKQSKIDQNCAELCLEGEENTQKVSYVHRPTKRRTARPTRRVVAYTEVHRHWSQRKSLLRNLLIFSFVSSKS